MGNKSELAKAIIAVMQDVEAIDKTMTVGIGQNSYKGVPDKEVKKIIGRSMTKHGLCILPVGVESKTQIDRWEEETTYGKKQKQSVFVESTTKYLLLHESGESQEIMGYGHGVDSQDKGAGKSTTYALKYALLYTFLVPTGKIDDSDSTHSEEIPVAQASKPTLNEKQFEAMKATIAKGDKESVKKAMSKYTISQEYSTELNNLLK